MKSSVVEFRMHEQHHKRTEAVVGDVSGEVVIRQQQRDTVLQTCVVTVDEDVQVMDSTDWFNECSSDRDEIARKL